MDGVEKDTAGGPPHVTVTFVAAVCQRIECAAS